MWSIIFCFVVDVSAFIVYDTWWWGIRGRLKFCLSQANSSREILSGTTIVSQVITSSTLTELGFHCIYTMRSALDPFMSSAPEVDFMMYRVFFFFNNYFVIIRYFYLVSSVSSPLSPNLLLKCYVIRGVEKWKYRKDFIFSYFCLVGSEKGEK